MEKWEEGKFFMISLECVFLALLYIKINWTFVHAFL